MKILIIDDHAMIRTGLKQLCEGRNDIVLEADNGRTALALAAAERPGLIVLDLNLPGVSGLELLRQLLEKDPAARVLVFSMHGESAYAARALKIGAKGYVSKNASPDELRLALQRVAAGLTYVENEIAQHLATLSGDQRQQLTDRDLEILRLLGEGRSFTEIAATLGLGYKTVANTATMIKSKLGVARTADLIRLSVEMGIPRQGPKGKWLDR
ncbi:MAG TPA: response regulator transcription factor [Rhizomicrobium sp.]|jgi:DNA-binding NarL/FixJ family response regulator|nr:response regulator transcription factor [Rhizomicrobium sp.]